MRTTMHFHSSPLSSLLSPVKFKIIRFLLKNEILMSEREIARILSVSHMSVNRAMRELEATNLVRPFRAGTSFLWKTNRQSYAYSAFTTLLESISRVPTPLEALKKDILQALPLAEIERIVLFGSIAKKRERRESDIDLFVLVKGEGEKARVEQVFESLSVLCLEKFGHPLSPYLRTQTEISARGKAKLDNELGSGIVIHPPDSAM
jgi:predicted nucleotidyltransferase/DNA-binding CsgD family transcriptional regulator